MSASGSPAAPPSTTSGPTSASCASSTTTTSTRSFPRRAPGGTSSIPTARPSPAAARPARGRRPRRRDRRQPMKTLGQGLAAGLIGTVCMTTLQEISVRRKRHAITTTNQDHSEQHDDPWQHAPAPAQLLKRAVEKATGIEPDPVAIPFFTNVMHWGYGTALGVAYAV